METRTAREKVIVPSHMLCKNFRQNIYSILRLKEGTCNRNEIILKIRSVDKIHGGKVHTADANNHFDVEYSYESVVPLVGETYNGTVFKSYQTGIIVIIFNSIKIMTAPDGTLKPGDVVRVKLTATMITGGDMCIGTGIIV